MKLEMYTLDGSVIVDSNLVTQFYPDYKSGERMALTRAVNILLSVGEDTPPYRYPVVLPEPLGFKPPSGRDVLLKNDVIAALMSAGVPIEGE